MNWASCPDFSRSKRYRVSIERVGQMVSLSEAVVAVKIDGENASSR